MAKRKAAQKTWTVLVYMAGDNDLDFAGVADLEEMKRAGSSRSVNIVVQFDRAGAGRKTHRYLVRKGTTLPADVVQSLGETNTGDPRVLEDFVTWGMRTYPAKRYLLVLWNHGSGWDDANVFEGNAFSGSLPPVVRGPLVVANAAGRGRGTLSSGQVRSALRRNRSALFRTSVRAAVSTRAIAFDDDAQDFLDNVEIRKVLARVKARLGRKIDVLGLDACLMGMLEVAFQVRGTAAFAVGSQETEPAEGWPYDRILKALVARPAMSARALSDRIVREYLASYPPGEIVTQSAVDLARVEPVATAVDRLAKALVRLKGDPAVIAGVRSARDQVQEYSEPYDEYVDLVDLAELIAKHVGDVAVGAACRSVVSAVRTCVVATGFRGKEVAHSRGLSIYFPKRKMSPLYDRLEFSGKNAWGAWVRTYLGAIGRRPR
ncbi:MAG TPA: clostripain-related cysteine peptidase [Candidatus Polarisedimenticolaceae bacterium]